MQQRSEETRTKILDAALHLFAHTGYEAAGVAEISTAAGVSKGAFYHHFRSKQAVFLELLRRWLDGLNQQLSNVRLDSTSTPQALMKMSEMASGIFQDAEGRLPMFIEFWIQACRDPDVWQATVAPYRQYEALFAGMMRQGIQEGTLKDVDAEATARTLMALAMGMLLQGLMDPDAARWEQALQQGVQFLLNGIAKENV